MREYGSEHPAVLIADGYFDSFNELNHCTWLRSGREALLLVALSNKGGVEHPTILMPAYCCHSMVDPFLKAGWVIVYYPLQNDLTANLQVLSILLQFQRPRAILSMNYFGSASTKDLIDCVKRNNPECICIEDFSHCTFSLRSIYNRDVDYYVSSIRKSVGICDGSVIISKNQVDESIIIKEETDFSKTRIEAQIIKRRYNYSQDSSSKNAYLSNLRLKETELDNFENVHSISMYAKKQLGSLNGTEIALARRINMRHILELFSGKISSIPGIERCLDGAPFSLPILVQNRDEIQRELSQKGVYAPVLWPISNEAREICPISAKMADHMLSIPIDQRYNYDDIEDIASIVLSIYS